MGSLNYSNFVDDGTQLVTTSPTEIVEAAQYEILSVPSKNRSGEAFASAISPWAALSNTINSAVDLVSDISKCITLVSIEKQKTKQVEVKAYAEIEESRQKTKRVKIQEKEITNRLIIQCKENLAIREMELRRLREENRFREVELRMNHKFYSQQLDRLDECVKSMIKEKNILLQILQDKTNDKPQSESILSSLNQVNENLVKLLAQIIALRER